MKRLNDLIIKRARQLARYSETTDPFRIAEDVGIEIHFEDLGQLKGMYAFIKRNRFIVINDRLCESMKRIVCAHELGHDQFHRDLAKNKWLHEFMIYNMNQRTEYEANIFASEILLPDNDVLELADEDHNIEQIAGALYSHVNLVALKLNTLSQQGYHFRNFESRDDFLK